MFRWCSHWKDPPSQERVLSRDMATLTISQVCGVVVVGQEEKPTPKPMWLTCKYCTHGALYTSPWEANFSHTIRFGREKELRKSKRKKGGARRRWEVSTYWCSKIVPRSLGMRWIQCQHTCMTLVICGLIWQMWLTGNAWGQLSLEGNCPRFFLLDMLGLLLWLFLLRLHPNM